LWTGVARPQHPTSLFFLRRYVPENIYGRNSEKLQKNERVVSVYKVNPEPPVVALAAVLGGGFHK